MTFHNAMLQSMHQATVPNLRSPNVILTSSPPEPEPFRVTPPVAFILIGAVFGLLAILGYAMGMP
jgi:hypothetical protein